MLLTGAIDTWYVPGRSPTSLYDLTQYVPFASVWELMPIRVTGSVNVTVTCGVGLPSRVTRPRTTPFGGPCGDRSQPSGRASSSTRATPGQRGQRGQRFTSCLLEGEVSPG